MTDTAKQKVRDYYKKNTERVGKCLIWTGRGDKTNPTIKYKGLKKPFRKYVYEQWNNVSLVDVKTHMKCGNEECVRLSCISISPRVDKIVQHRSYPQLILTPGRVMEINNGFFGLEDAMLTDYERGFPEEREWHLRENKKHANWLKRMESRGIKPKKKEDLEKKFKERKPQGRFNR